MGWRCRNSKYIHFRFVLTISVTVAMNDHDNIIIGIYLLLMPWKSNISNSTFDTSIIDIEEFKTGSTVISGAADPSEVPLSCATNQISYLHTSKSSQNANYTPNYEYS